MSEQGKERRPLIERQRRDQRASLYNRTEQAIVWLFRWAGQKNARWYINGNLNSSDVRFVLGQPCGKRLGRPKLIQAMDETLTDKSFHDLSNKNNIGVAGIGNLGGALDDYRSELKRNPSLEAQLREEMIRYVAISFAPVRRKRLTKYLRNLIDLSEKKHHDKWPETLDRFLGLHELAMWMETSHTWAKLDVAELARKNKTKVQKNGKSVDKDLMTQCIGRHLTELEKLGFLTANRHRNGKRFRITYSDGPNLWNDFDRCLDVKKRVRSTPLYETRTEAGISLFGTSHVTTEMQGAIIQAVTEAIIKVFKGEKDDVRTGLLKKYPEMKTMLTRISDGEIAIMKARDTALGKLFDAGQLKYSLAKLYERDRAIRAELERRIKKIREEEIDPARLPIITIDPNAFAIRKERKPVPVIEEMAPDPVYERMMKNFLSGWEAEFQCALDRVDGDDERAHRLLRIAMNEAGRDKKRVTELLRDENWLKVENSVKL